MQRNWTTRNYQPGDERGINKLWKTVFSEGEHERAELDYWKWQYMNSPAGPGKIRLAVDNGKIAGQYAVVPMHMQVQAAAVLGTLSLDTMTHPDYRRQGMFTILANELYEQLGKGDIPITYGFPNDNSLGGFVKKLEWTHICTLPIYVKPINLAKIVEQAISKRWLAKAAYPLAEIAGAVVSRKSMPSSETVGKLDWIERFDQSADELWQRAYAPNKIAVTRDAKYLNWRYFDNPKRDYRAIAFREDGELVAYGVMRFMEQFGLNGLMIMELVSQPGRREAIQAVLSAIYAFSKDAGADLVACMAHTNDTLIYLLKRNGYILPPDRFSIKSWYFGVRVNNQNVNQKVINNPNHWYLTFGDTDII
jgi:hypothetical protein